MKGSLALFTMAVIGFLIYVQVSQYTQVSKLDSFYDRCKAQGGVVLNSTKRDGGGWVGCYSGVKELPNES